MKHNEECIWNHILCLLSFGKLLQTYISAVVQILCFKGHNMVDYIEIYIPTWLTLLCNPGIRKWTVTWCFLLSWDGLRCIPHRQRQTDSLSLPTSQFLEIPTSTEAFFHLCFFHSFIVGLSWPIRGFQELGVFSFQAKTVWPWGWNKSKFMQCLICESNKVMLWAVFLLWLQLPGWYQVPVIQ